MVTLFALWTIARANPAPSATVLPKHLSAESCEILLDRGVISPVGQGDELCTWITGSHPLLAEAVDGCGNVRELFSLLYLQRGFTLPPRRRVRKPTLSQRHFEEVVSFTTGEPGYANLRARVDGAAAGRDGAARKSFAAEVAQNLATTLVALSDPAYDLPGAAPGGFLNIYLDLILRGEPAAAGRVHALFASSFAKARRSELRRLARELNEPAGRAYVYRFVRDNLGALIDANDRTLAALNSLDKPAPIKAELIRAAADLDHQLNLKPQRTTPDTFRLREIDLFSKTRPLPTRPEDVPADAAIVDSFLNQITEHLRQIEAPRLTLVGRTYDEIGTWLDLGAAELRNELHQLRRADARVHLLKMRTRRYVSPAATDALTERFEQTYVAIAERLALVTEELSRLTAARDLVTQSRGDDVAQRIARALTPVAP